MDFKAQYPTQEGPFFCSISVDATGDYALGGFFSKTLDLGAGPMMTSGTYNQYLASFSSANAAKWSQTFLPTSGAGQVVNVAMTDTGDVYGGGTMIGTWTGTNSVPLSANSQSQVVFKLDPAGKLLWSKLIPNANLRAYSVDKGGRLLACGSIEGDADLGLGLVKHQGGGDVAIVIFAPDGKVDYAAAFGDKSAQLCTGIHAASNGDVLVSGSFYGTLKMGASSITTQGGKDVFVARIKTP